MTDNVERAAVLVALERFAGEAELGIAFNTTNGDRAGVAKHHHTLNRFNACLDALRALPSAPTDEPRASGALEIVEWWREKSLSLSDEFRTHGQMEKSSIYAHRMGMCDDLLKELRALPDSGEVELWNAAKELAAACRFALNRQNMTDFGSQEDELALVRLEQALAGPKS